MQNNNNGNQFNGQQQFNNGNQFNGGMPPQNFNIPKKPWYQQTWAIILFLIFFFPVGLFLMWKYSNWKTAPKVIVTVFIAIIFIYNIDSSNNKDTTTTNKTESSSSKEETTKTENKADQVEQEKTQEQIDQEKKEKAEKEAKEKAEAEQKAAQEKAEAEQKAAQEAAEYDNSVITFDNLARNPDQFKGQKVKFTGTIIQVIEGWGKTQYRFAINDDYNEVILLTIDEDMLKNGKILENDNVTIKGISEGTVDYKAVLGNKITIPSITVKQFQINQK